MVSLPTTSKDFLTLADEVTDQFFKNGTPLNEGVAKVAIRAALNPEEVKRLVEKSNVVATVRMLRMSTDKKATIDLADYDAVIEKTHPSDDESYTEEPTHEKTAVLREERKRRNTYMDLMDVFKIHGQQKTASDSKKNTDHIAVFKLGKQVEELKLRKIATEAIVKDSIDFLASEFSKYNAPDFQKFASEAVALHGKVCLPVLDSLAAYVKCKYDLTKTAEYIIDDTTQMHVKLAEICTGLKALVWQDSVIKQASDALDRGWRAAKGYVN